jgi:hypothetical protein
MPGGARPQKEKHHLLDSDNLVAVASYVEGLSEVVDRTELRVGL